MILHKFIRQYVLETHVPTSTLGECVSFHVLFNDLDIQIIYPLKAEHVSLMKRYALLWIFYFLSLKIKCST